MGTWKARAAAGVSQHQKPNPKSSVTNNPMKIFRLSEIEWWMANTLEEAISTAMKETGCSREEVLEEGYGKELTDEQLDQYRFCDREPSEDEMAFENWKCPDCGAIADGYCRWNGDAYEHPHPYPLGHILMTDTTVRTFREELAARVAAGCGPEIFASSEI